ncbi:MAG: tRNA threonylcarbamoyladenosine dehydratase, partial [Luteolibacter sp.]
ALERFSQSHVAVVGVVGVGSWSVEALARSGVGKITLCALDEICISNVNRQLHAADGQIGRQKTEVMAERAKSINPDIQVRIVPRFFSSRSVAEFFKESMDGVIDAIDTTAHKALLLAETHCREIFTVSCGAAGGRRDPTRIRVTDLAFSGKDPLLHQVRRSLRRDHGFPNVPQGTKPQAMGIDAVFSDEAPVMIACESNQAHEEAPKSSRKLSCESGFGSVTHVTAAFGLTAAGRVLEFLARSA